MKRRVLVVDDEAANRDAFRMALRRDGFQVETAGDAAAALKAARARLPALALVDVAMPGEDGVTLCRLWKSAPRTAAIPVILMSGVRQDEEDQVGGMSVGADDYLLKPFTPKLLTAKVRAVLRRYDAPRDLREVLQAQGLVLDVGGRVVRVGRRRVELTRKEFDLLAALLERRGRPLSARALLETVWGYDPALYNDTRTIVVHASSLRRKLGRRLGARIVAVPDRGYRFET